MLARKRTKDARPLCNAHSKGVLPGSPPFFYPGCEVCEDKKARGQVTGEEGPLPGRAFGGRINVRKAR